MAMQDSMEEAIAYVVGLFQDPASFAESPLDDVATHLGSENYEEVDPYQVLEQAMDQLGYDDATQEAVMAAANANATAEATATATATAEGGYSIEELAGIFAEGIKVTIDNSETINQIDNSLYVEGDVKGGIHQANYTEVTNVDAAEGAIAAGGDIHGQQQTGDGTQIDDTYAEDITTGDYNTSADDGGTIGDGNVAITGSHVTDAEFGDGDKTTDNSYEDNSYTDNTYTDNTADSYNTNIEDAHNVKDSYDYEHEHSDDDYVNVEVDTGYGHDDHYEPPVVEEHGYEPVAEVYETEEHYEEPVEDEVYD